MIKKKISLIYYFLLFLFLFYCLSNLKVEIDHVLILQLPLIYLREFNTVTWEVVTLLTVRKTLCLPRQTDLT